MGLAESIFTYKSQYVSQSLKQFARLDWNFVKKLMANCIVLAKLLPKLYNPPPGLAGKCFALTVGQDSILPLPPRKRIPGYALRQTGRAGILSCRPLATWVSLPADPQQVIPDKNAHINVSKDANMVAISIAGVKKDPTTAMTPKKPVARPRNAVTLLNTPLNMTRPAMSIPSDRVSVL